MTRQHCSNVAQIDRRSFCANAVVTSTAAVLLTPKTLAAVPAQHERLAVYPPMKIEGAERLTPGSSLYFDYPRHDDKAVLLRNAEGEFFAFSRKCAHLGCVINFESTRNCLTCPCHRGTYDSRTGYVIYGPPPQPLDQIVLQIRAGGEVWAVGKTLGNNNSARAERARQTNSVTGG